MCTPGEVAGAADFRRERRFATARKHRGAAPWGPQTAHNLIQKWQMRPDRYFSKSQRPQRNVQREKGNDSSISPTLFCRAHDARALSPRVYSGTPDGVGEASSREEEKMRKTKKRRKKRFALSAMSGDAVAPKKRAARVEEASDPKKNGRKDWFHL